MSTELIAACEEKNAGQVRAALAAGADPNTVGKHGPLLYEAIQRKAKAIVTLLLDAGADPALLDGDQRTALHWLADELADAPLARAVLGKGVSGALIDRRGDTAFHLAVRLHKKPDFALALLDGGVSIEVVNDEQQTPLHLLCKSKSGEMTDSEIAFAKVLIERGANIDAVDDNLTTPLHYAARSSGEMTSLLLERGAKILRTKQGNTPLKYSIHTHAKDTVRWNALIAAGCGLDDQNDSGSTALIESITSHNPTAARYFLKRGADVTLKDRSGKTALDYANEYQKPLVPMLEAAAAK